MGRTGMPDEGDPFQQCTAEACRQAFVAAPEKYLVEQIAQSKGWWGR